MAMTIRTFKPDGTSEIKADSLLTDDLLADESALLWIDIAEPTAPDIEMVAAAFGAPDFIAEDLLKGQQRPKIHVEHDFVLIVAYGIDLDGGSPTVRRHEVDILLGRNAIVTVRHDPKYGLTAVLDRLANASNVFERGVTLILYDLLDEIVDGYFTTVDQLEDYIDGTEQLLFAVSPEKSATDRALQERIFDIRKQVVAFYQISTAMRDVLNGILRHDVEMFPETIHLHFLDIYDHLMRVNSSLELFRELLAGIFEAHLAVASNQMNNVMKKMTSWGAILLGAALIAGIYGMNFREMPELRFIYGYPMALGMMGALTITLWIVFKRKNWL